MQPVEFNTFVEKLFTAFPSLHEWISNAEKVKDPKGTKLVWYRTLETVSLTEAMSVLDRWTTGALKAFSAFERDLVAVSIRAIVEQDRSRATKRGVETKQGLEDSNKFRKDYSPIAPVLAAAIQLSRTGTIDVAKYIAQHMPSTPAHSQPRYHCYICCDRGKVEVWRNDLARGVDSGILSIDAVHGSYVVACACSAGDHYATENNYWRPLPRYQPDQFCRWHNGTIESERVRLQKWLVERVEAEKLTEFASWAG